MLSTKRTAKSIGALYKEPCHANVNGKRIEADHIAIAEINKELTEAAKEAKIQSVESKILAKSHYAGG